jgi:hypothetical protein
VRACASGRRGCCAVCGSHASVSAQCRRHCELRRAARRRSLSAISYCSGRPRQARCVVRVHALLLLLLPPCAPSRWSMAHSCRHRRRNRGTDCGALCILHRRGRRAARRRCRRRRGRLCSCHLCDEDVPVCARECVLHFDLVLRVQRAGLALPPLLVVLQRASSAPTCGAAAAAGASTRRFSEYCRTAFAARVRDAFMREQVSARAPPPSAIPYMYPWLLRILHTLQHAWVAWVADTCRTQNVFVCAVCASPHVFVSPKGTRALPRYAEPGVPGHYGT